MQQISLGKLLYAYFYLDLKFPESVFLDPKTRDFIKALYQIKVEQVGKVDVWNGIEIQPCTEFGIKNEVYSAYFRQAINIRHVDMCKSLERADWYDLVKHFPEVSESIQTSSKIIKASKLKIKIPEFKPFFPKWDQAFYGVLPDDFIVMYAIAKLGKSTNSNYICAQAIKAGKSVAYYPTEDSVDKTACSIFGFLLDKPLRPDESIHYFNKFPEKMEEVQEKYGEQLTMPEDKIFEWSRYEELYKQKPDFVILDQMSLAMNAYGLEDVDAKQAGKFCKQLLAMQNKYCIPSLVVMQEGYRPPTPEERKKYSELADRMEFGSGNARGTNAPKQDASLSLNLVFDQRTRERSLIVRHDRYRNLTSGERVVEVMLDSRGNWIVGTLKAQKDDYLSDNPNSNDDFTGESLTNYDKV